MAAARSRGRSIHPACSARDGLLLAGLSPLPGATLFEEHSYFDWQNRLAPAVEFIRSTGQWALFQGPRRRRG